MSVFFSPYENYQNQSVLFDKVVQSLEEIGIVETGGDETTSLLISFSSQVKFSVVSPVVAIPNGFETASAVWTAYGGGGAPPEVEDGKVVFLDTTIADADHLKELARVSHAFAVQYRRDNPNGSKPVFYLSGVPD